MTEPITAATCKIRKAHTPHEECPGSAPEYPWEPVVRDTDGTILYGPSLICGCPLDSGCDGQHVR